MESVILGYSSQKNLLGSDSCVLAQKAQNLKNQGCLELDMRTRQTASEQPDQQSKNHSKQRIRDASRLWVCHTCSLLKLAVVLALNWHAGLCFDAIAIKVHVKSLTLSSPTARVPTLFEGAFPISPLTQQ